MKKLPSPLILANGFNRLVTVTTQIFVGQILDPSQLGAYVLAAAYVNIFSLFQSGDLPRLALQAKGNENSTAWSIGRILLFGSVLTGALAILVSHFFGAPAVAMVAALAAIPFLRIIGNVRLTLLSHAAMSHRIAVISTCEGLTRSLSVIGFALAGAGAWSLIAGELLAVVASTALLCAFERSARGRASRLQKRAIQGMLSVVGIALLVSAERELTAIILGAFSGIAVTGSYAFANRISGQLTIIVIPIIIIEAIPRLISANAHRDEFRSRLDQERNRLLRITVPLTLAVGIVAPFAIVYVWGNKWHEAAMMLPALAIVACVRLGYSFNKGALEAMGAMRTILALSIIDVAIITAVVVGCSILLNSAFVPYALGFEAAIILFISARLVSKHQNNLAF